MAKLIITRDAMPVQEVELDAGRTTIGRHPHNDIVIGHLAVSARHAAIARGDDGAATLEDIGSSNGTFVNGRRIARAVLADGDKVTIANVVIEYLAHASVTAPVPVASVEVLDGGNAGKTLTLVKPLTTLGSPGLLVVVISRQPDGYFLAQLQGHAVAQVNGEALGTSPRRLRDGDVLELTGTRMRFAAKIV